jgi:cytochrome c oxidase subunit 2
VAADASTQAAEPNHARRMLTLWLVASVIGEILLFVLLYPHMPPGNATQEAHNQVVTNTVISAIMIPIIMMVWVYFGYAVAVFRRRPGDTSDGPYITGHMRVQTVWMVVTSAIVLFLAAFGTYALADNGAGGGQGPSPLFTPSGGQKVLQVQVIAQQWWFTFRYPSYGGVETAVLEIPSHTTVEFDVTSLDVVHSFWAYQLGVKADAVLGADNHAFVETKNPISFNIRCAELCGLWHGYMAETGYVVSPSDFAKWISRQRFNYRTITPNLPPYAPSYIPAPNYRAG